ncbi:MAG: GNAT family N-acetyltransferase [Candidatus Methylumidiphilus sp.]
MKLQAITEKPPPGALGLLAALGDGENGFGGTAVGGEPGRLADWLEYCVHLANSPPLSDDFPQQHNFWLLDAEGQAIGLIRMNPRLNAELLNWGGHVGYYIIPAKRRLGYGKTALRLALNELRRRGVKRALITVETHNVASRRIILKFGGILEDERTNSHGQAYRRYWLDTVKTF